MCQRTVRKISYSGRRPRGRRILADKSNIPLLLSYDANNDGKVSQDEFMKACKDGAFASIK